MKHVISGSPRTGKTSKLISIINDYHNKHIVIVGKHANNEILARVSNSAKSDNEIYASDTHSTSADSLVKELCWLILFPKAIDVLIVDSDCMLNSWSDSLISKLLSYATIKDIYISAISYSNEQCELVRLDSYECLNSI